MAFDDFSNQVAVYVLNFGEFARKMYKAKVFVGFCSFYVVFKMIREYSKFHWALKLLESTRKP